MTYIISIMTNITQDEIIKIKNKLFAHQFTEQPSRIKLNLFEEITGFSNKKCLIVLDMGRFDSWACIEVRAGLNQAGISYEKLYRSLDDNFDKEVFIKKLKEKIEERIDFHNRVYAKDDEIWYGCLSRAENLLWHLKNNSSYYTFKKYKDKFPDDYEFRDRKWWNEKYDMFRRN